jgi:glycerophosphoryl diester phosphodiesterase
MFDTFQIIGHRGFAGKYPDNTIEGFSKAIEAGATMIEFDVQLTFDYKLAVAHDQLPRSATNLLLLSDVFDEFKDSINYYVELKTYNSTPPDSKTRLVFYTISEIIRKNLKRNCLIASFDEGCLKTAKQLGYPKLGAIYANDKTPLNTRVHCPAHKLIKKPVSQLTFAWTVNDKRRMKTLMKLGVQGIVTDHPDRLAEVCETIPSYAA